ncbi:response regulator transcription factor [Pontiellaceae bacterium B12227]|nr:response regulator transcription factor [Pontiellaceae bacterium B12227]
MKKNIQVMMVEDHPEYREVIEIALQKASGIELISEFGTAERALRSLQDMSTRQEPDIILLDLNLPGMSGLDAIPYFSKTIPESRIIILSQSNQEADVLQAITLGAAGYLLKSSTVKTITDAISTVMEGGAPIDAGVAKYILATLKAPPQKEESFPPLSDREMEILTLVAKGHLKKEIAELLGISVYTVVTHTGHIYQKLNVANAPSAIDKAHTLGLFRNKK